VSISWNSNLKKNVEHISTKEHTHNTPPPKKKKIWNMQTFKRACARCAGTLTFFYNFTMCANAILHFNNFITFKLWSTT
jgi:hypothetical protein